MPDSPSRSPEDKQPHEVPEVLKGPSTFVIKRLNDGDPLEIWPRVIERLQTKCFLVEGSRLHLRTLARVAHASLTYRGEVPLHEFLTTQIDKSMKELVVEDQEEEARGIPPDDPWDRRYAMISENLGVSPLLARRAAIRFNRLGLAERRTFFAIALEGKPVNRWIAEGNGPPSKVEEEMRRALEALSPQPGKPDVDLDGEEV